MKIFRNIAEFTPVLTLAFFAIAAADEQVRDRAVDIFSHIAFLELGEDIVTELVRSGLAERDAVNSANTAARRMSECLVTAVEETDTAVARAFLEAVANSDSSEDLEYLINSIEAEEEEKADFGEFLTAEVDRCMEVASQTIGIGID